MSSNAGEAILVAEKISKRFPGTVALDGVDFTVYAGTVNVLIGENGAGKSTLMKILAGVDRPTSGRLLLQGVPVEFKSTREAAQAGIGIIFQELNLYPNLSISENIFVARELTRNGVVQHRQQEQITAELLQRLEQPLKPGTLVRDLRMGQQQIVEIAKALSQNVRILIMDEPTSALTAAETEALFRIIADLKANGVAIIYISHKLEELLRIGDYVTVLRDGKLAASAPARSVTVPSMIEKMVGRNVNAPRHRLGLVQKLSVAQNITLANLNRLVNWFWLSDKRETEEINAMIRSLAIKTSNPKQSITALSGGNQQKVVIAKSLLTEPRVLMLDEPTRGIDVGAKAEIFEIMNQLAEKGLAVLFVSSELPEMFTIPDRVIVLSKGKITGEFLHDELTEEALVLAAGAHKQTEHPVPAGQTS
jgi:ABC-type sugar transport system ATPase subunit